MAKNKMRYQDLGLGPDTDIVGSQEPFLVFMSEGEATSINDLPIVVSVEDDEDFMIVYVPGTGHRKILVKDIGAFFPSGGDAGQILVKSTNEHYDVSWINVPVGGGGLVDEGNTITLSGDLSGNGMFNSNGNMALSAILDLPTVVLIDGGSAFSVFTASLTGPYGVSNMLPAGGLTGEALVKSSDTDQDADWLPKADPIEIRAGNTLVLTDDVKRIDFTGPGVQITSPAAGQIIVDIDGRPLVDSSEFCPQFPPTYIDGNTWSIVGHNKADLFSVTRRLAFYDDIFTYYGTISAVDYNVTTAGDTTITMDMENGAVISSGIDKVCITSGASGWQLINVQPLGVFQMNAIAVGQLFGVTTWIIVGNNGELATSTDGGETWDLQVVATANNLRGVAYSSADEVFCVVGNGDEFWRSFDGINWTGGFNQDLADNSSYDRGDEHARIEYSAITDEFIWCFHKNDNHPASFGKDYYNLVATSDLGVTFESLASDLGMLPRGNREHNIKGLHITCKYNNLWHSEEGNVYTFPNSTHPHIVRHNFINETWLAVDERGVGAKSSEANGDSGWTASTTNPWATLDVCNNVINSVLLNPLAIAVGENAKISVSEDDGDNWVEVSNGFDISANIIDVAYSEVDKKFIAIATNGQIGISINGHD